MKKEGKDAYGDEYVALSGEDMIGSRTGTVAAICVESPTTNALVFCRDASIELGLFLLGAAGVDTSMVKT